MTDTARQSPSEDPPANYTVDPDTVVLHQPLEQYDTEHTDFIAYELLGYDDFGEGTRAVVARYAVTETLTGRYHVIDELGQAALSAEHTNNLFDGTARSFVYTVYRTGPTRFSISDDFDDFDQ